MSDHLKCKGNFYYGGDHREPLFYSKICKIVDLSKVFLFWFLGFFFLGCSHGKWKFSGQGSNPSCSVTYAAGCSNAVSFTCWAEPGMEPEPPKRQAGSLPTAPQWELLSQVLTRRIKALIPSCQGKWNNKDLVRRQFWVQLNQTFACLLPTLKSLESKNTFVIWFWQSGKFLILEQKNYL